MAPDVKIRGLDEATYARLKARAQAEGSSMESLLREIVAEAVIDTSESDWVQIGFDEPDEIVPGRFYSVIAAGRHFRIMVTRALDERSTKWNSDIDELVEIEFVVDNSKQRVRVWTNPLGIADRHLGDTAEMALRDAMHWLADYAGIDLLARVRLRQILEEEADPSLSALYVALSKILAGEASLAWLNKHTFRISTVHFSFVLSRLADSVVITTFHANTNIAAENHEQHVRLVTDAAARVAAIIRKREYLHQREHPVQK